MEIGNFDATAKLRGARAHGHEVRWPGCMVLAR